MREQEVLESVLATVCEMLLAEGLTEAADILRTTVARVEETGYDNWNGGMTLWTIYLPSLLPILRDWAPNVPSSKSKSAPAS